MSPFAFTSSFLQNSTHKERAKGGSKRRKVAESTWKKYHIYAWPLLSRPLICCVAGYMHVILIMCIAQLHMLMMLHAKVRDGSQATKAGFFMIDHSIYLGQLLPLDLHMYVLRACIHHHYDD